MLYFCNSLDVVVNKTGLTGVKSCYALVAIIAGVSISIYRVPFCLNREAAKPHTICQLCSFTSPSSDLLNCWYLFGRWWEHQPT